MFLHSGSQGNTSVNQALPEQNHSHSRLKAHGRRYLSASLVAVVLAGMAAGAIAQQPRWMISSTAIHLFDQAGGSGDVFYAAPGNIIMNGTKGSEGFPEGSKAMPAITFASYAALKAALDEHRLPKETKAVIYDNEAWEFTPSEEQHDIAKYEKLAAEAAHSHGLLLIAAPATDLTRILSPDVKTKRYDEYLRLGIAGDAARYADIYEIQVQGSLGNLDIYTHLVKGAVAQARAANPKIIVFAGLSTNPSGKQVTAKDLYDAVQATRGDIAGYWLNIPKGGSACPRCGEPQPQVAVELLKMLQSPPPQPGAATPHPTKSSQE